MTRRYLFYTTPRSKSQQWVADKFLKDKKMSEDLEIQCPYCLKQLDKMPINSAVCGYCGETYYCYQIKELFFESKPKKDTSCFVESPDEIQDLLGRIGQ